MFKTILLPIDVAHPEDGHKALEFASAIMSLDTALILLYVMEDIPNWTEIDLPPNFKENSMQKAREALESIAENFDKELQIKVQTGHAYSTILKAAEAVNADLVILASHKPGLKEYFIGSNATKVVSHANCSVVVLR